MSERYIILFAITSRLEKSKVIKVIASLDYIQISFFFKEIIIYSCTLQLFISTDKQSSEDMATRSTGGQQQANGEGNLASPRKKQRVTGSDMSKVTVVLGAQWGDEGKGKAVDMLAMEADVVCRCQVILYELSLYYYFF